MWHLHEPPRIRFWICVPSVLKSPPELPPVGFMCPGFPTCPRRTPQHLGLAVTGNPQVPRVHFAKALRVAVGSYSSYPR